MKPLSSNMIDSTQLREYVIRPVLKPMDLYSTSAENLLVMIAAHESKMGTYLRQLGGGPACGIYQMEVNTAMDVWTYIRRRADWTYEYMVDLEGDVPLRDSLTWNIGYQTALARIHLLRFEEPIPPAEDLQGLAEYAKKYWNTSAGKATPEDYLEAYLPHHI